MKTIYVKASLAILIATLLSLAIAQSKLTLVSPPKTSLAKQLEIILNEVNTVTGKDFNIAIKIDAKKDGGFFAAYEIAGQKDLASSGEDNAIGREILNVNIFGPPAFGYTWSITQNNGQSLMRTNIDGSITQIDLTKQKINSVGELIKESPMSIDQQFAHVLAQVEEMTGKQFDSIIEESIFDDGSGRYTRAYSIGNQEREFDAQTNKPKSPEALSISVSRYPNRPKQSWVISQSIGDELFLSHFGGAVTKDTSIESATIKNTGIDEIFNMALDEVFSETGQRFDQIIAERNTKTNWARAYKISADGTQESPILSITVFNTSDGKRFTWSIPK